MGIWKQWVLAALLPAISVGSSGCGGPKQLCECAVHVGGTTPATDADSRARSDALAQCLEARGGGTISGCPMPASVQPMDAPDDEPADEPWSTLSRTPSDAVAGGDDLSGTWWETTEALPPGPREQAAPCRGPVVGHWSFEQRDYDLQAEHRATTSYRSGVRGRMFVPAYTFVVGSREGSLVALEGRMRPGYMDYGPDDGSRLARTEVPEEERVVLVLSYDEATGHLVGTKNDEPVRFVPLRLVERTEPCPPAARERPPA